MTRLRALARVLERRTRVAARLDGFAESAVLVPIVVETGAPERLLFTVRSPHLPTHAGQISFPGGKRDPDDRDAPATAIREASEELGVEPAAVDVLGSLDDFPTPSGFMITPVVATLRGPLALTPSPDEVAEVFACELDALGAPGCHIVGETRRFLGVDFVMHEYHWGRHRIWGATARIVHQLLELVAQGEDEVAA